MTSRFGTTVRATGDEAEVDVDDRQVGSRASYRHHITWPSVGCEQVAKEIVEFRVRQGRITDRHSLAGTDDQRSNYKDHHGPGPVQCLVIRPAGSSRSVKL